MTRPPHLCGAGVAAAGGFAATTTDAWLFVAAGPSLGPLTARGVADNVTEAAERFSESFVLADFDATWQASASWRLTLGPGLRF